MTGYQKYLIIWACFRKNSPHDQCMKLVPQKLMPTHHTMFYPPQNWIQILSCRKNLNLGNNETEFNANKTL